MGNHHISPDLKECALSLWDRGWAELDICEALGISHSSLFHWRSIFNEFGSPQHPPSPLRGQTRVIMRAVINAIHLLYMNDPDMYLDEIQWWLAVHHDIAISLPALHQNLSEAGLTCKILTKIAQECDQQHRDEWRETITGNFGQTGSEFVFVDETSKN
jgi:transposase